MYLKPPVLHKRGCYITQVPYLSLNGNLAMSENLDLLIENVGESIGDLISNSYIPATIRKNVFSAIGQLGTALVDIPIAHFEGIAAEKRAETAARIKSINEIGNQIVEAINVDEKYARVAQKKHADKIVREQVNLDKISKHAIIEIAKKISHPNSDENKSEIPDIDLDWLNAFEAEASKKSTAEMQRLFGKILAGEITQPSSFSIRTVRLISQIDASTAQLFVNLCSICTSLRVNGKLCDSRVISLGGNAGHNALQSYGIGFEQLTLLQEYGLIITDTDSWRDYGHSITKNDTVGISFEYMNENWALKRNVETDEILQLKLHGVALSRAGMELLEIVDLMPNQKYNEALSNYFRSLNLNMIKVRFQNSKIY